MNLHSQTSSLTERCVFTHTVLSLQYCSVQEGGSAQGGVYLLQGGPTAPPHRALQVWDCIVGPFASSPKFLLYVFCLISPRNIFFFLALERGSNTLLLVHRNKSFYFYIDYHSCSLERTLVDQSATSSVAAADEHILTVHALGNTELARKSKWAVHTR